MGKKDSSAWNKLGTWEEKEYDFKKVKEFVESQLTQKKYDDFQIAKIAEIEGDFNSVFIRGKTKLGFTLKMELHLSGVERMDDELADEGLGKKHSILNVEEFTDYGDQEVVLTYSGASRRRDMPR